MNLRIKLIYSVLLSNYDFSRSKAAASLLKYLH